MNGKNSEKNANFFKQDLSLILPCYNEKDNLKPVVESALKILKEIAREFEIIIVDDGSTDGTGELAEELVNIYPQVRLVQHPKNLGYGSALRSGFKKAKYRWLFFTDADQQFDLSEIKKLLPYLEQSPLVIGYRQNRRDKFHRRLLGELFSFLMRNIFKIKARDVNCAFKIFDRKILEGVELKSPGALINAELLYRAKEKGIEPIEVAVSHFPRKTGKPSGGSFRVIFRAGWETIRLIYHFWREKIQASRS